VLERQTRLTEWLSDVLHRRVPATAELRARRAARNDPALRAACELLADDPAVNVTLDALAAVAGVSRFRLTRLFRTGLGLPPHRYQVAQRVRLARALLEQGHAPGAAAALAGFTDQSHLHRHFRRALGITPGRYAALTAAARTNVQDAAGPAA
jgi:AraC-like DNA-binding protein